MKKTIYILAALTLLMAMTATALQDYRAESWKNHANTPVGAGDTELNVNEKCVYDVKPWGYTVWGVGSRYSDGSIKCAIPGDSKRKRTQTTSSNPVVNPPVDPPKPSCEELNNCPPPLTCEELNNCPIVCHTEKVCEWIEFNENNTDHVCKWKWTGNHWTYQCKHEKWTCKPNKGGCFAWECKNVEVCV
jgi:hypothetical protein